MTPAPAPLSHPAPTVVVASLSVRQLAASARRAGWQVIALDAFGDADTRAASLQWMDLAAPADEHGLPRLDGDRLAPALAQAAAAITRAGGRALGWIAGSGFEARPELLRDAALTGSVGPAGRLPLLGMDSAAVGAVREPHRFFARLATLGVPHPPVCAEPPPFNDPGWLRKDMASCGGLGVQPWTAALARAASTQASTPSAAPSFSAPYVYWQRRQAGQPLGSLALARADGSVELIGVHRLLSTALSPQRPHAYAGVIGPVPLAPAVRAALAGHLARLGPAFGLRGLFSADWLLDEAGRLWLLEINPRPSASLAVHDREDGGGPAWLAAHAQAFAPTTAGAKSAQIQAASNTVAPVSGELIVLAPTPLHFTPADVQRWQADGDVRDLPCLADHAPGLSLPAGAPICSLHATGRHPAEVERRLRQRQAGLLAALGTPIDRRPSAAQRQAGPVPDAAALG